MAINRTLLPDGCPPLGGYYFYLTGGCNLACQHCWLSPSFQVHGDTGGHLDFELFKQAIDEALPLGLGTAKLTGGEPLLHPDFIRMVDYLAEHNLSLGIETNGTLMTAEIARHLKEKSTLSNISVSVDGATPETHDKFRGVKGSFQAACKGVQNLVAVGIHPQIIMSLTSENLHEIEPLIAMAESLGASSVKFNLIQSAGRGKVMNDRGRGLTVERQVALGNWIDGELQSRTKIALHYSWPFAFHSIDRILKNPAAGSGCSIFNIMGVLHTGQLAMCGIGVQVSELVYGQLGVDRVVDVWTSHPMLLKLREDLPHKLEGICGECIMRDRCLGYCIAHNYHGAGSLTAANWFCAAAHESGLFPETRRLPMQQENVSLPV